MEIAIDQFLEHSCCFCGSTIRKNELYYTNHIDSCHIFKCSRHEEQLNNIYNAIADSILEMTDEEVIEEVAISNKNWRDTTNQIRKKILRKIKNEYLS